MACHSPFPENRRPDIFYHILMSDTKFSEDFAPSSSLTHGITVIIPIFNRAGIIGETLRSIEAQTRWPDRVILVDNNSTDASLDVVNQWAGQRREEGRRVDVIIEKQPGAAAARKAGERLVDTRYLYFFDSDDFMHPDLIEKAMEDFESDSSLKISVWSLLFLNHDGTKRARRIHADRPLENHLVQGLLSTQAYAADTEYFRSAGGWNSDIGGWDDWELGLRLLLAGGKIHISDDIRAEIRVHKDSITGLSYLHRKGDWEMTIDEMERQVRESINPMKAYILRMLAYRRTILAAHYRHEGDRRSARSLLSSALSTPGLSKFQCLILRIAYLFTSLGIRGAGCLFPPLLAQ